MSNDTKKRFNWRAFVSVLTALSFVGMTLTGVILFVVPPGRVANWTGWTLMALTKQQWIGLHDWFSLIFVVASVFHLYLNWKAFVGYFKSKVSRAFALRTEWVVALVVCAVVLLGTIVGVRPFSSLQAWSEGIKHRWEDPRRLAPIPHAELLSLTELAERVPDVGLETMLANLKAQGIDVDSPDVVLGTLAESCNMTPLRLYNIALGQAEPVRGHGGPGQAGGHAPGGRGGGPGGGMGQFTLKGYCEQIGLDVTVAVKKLQAAGFKAGPDMTIRGIADSAGVHPSEIRGVLEPPDQQP